ncbi:MAG TPA: proprotein convertase P-domain-containing protein, partial [Flavobacterium sp.]|nr:proprotein convertase P-domain-containing protein [Flavobacterium sp.]
NVPLTISPLGSSTVNSTLTVATGAVISDVNVSVNLSHDYISDMTATLISPSGTQVRLFAEVCGDNTDVAATFDDSGNALVCGESPAITGFVVPSQALAAFNGQNSAGTWTLRLRDGYSGDGGVLNSWSLNICSVQEALKVTENNLSDFVVYPNPSNGNFNVRFDSPSSGKIAIEVFDISGRLIFSHDYASQGNFNQNIQLDNVQAGVYILNVSDGNAKQAKRIVIE